MPRKKWKGPTGKHQGKTAQTSNFRPVNPLAYSVLMLHTLYLLLHKEYGLDKKEKEFLVISLLFDEL